MSVLAVLGFPLTLLAYLLQMIGIDLFGFLEKLSIK